MLGLGSPEPKLIHPFNRGTQEGQMFKTILSFIACANAPWAIRDPLREIGEGREKAGRET